MLVELAYIHQLRGQNEEAKKLYEEVMESKCSDKSALAVCAVNMVPLVDKHFDVLKRMERTRQQETYENLSVAQREGLSFNYAVVLLKMGRTEPCLKVLDEMEKEFPKSHSIALLRASLLLADKKTDQVCGNHISLRWSHSRLQAEALLLQSNDESHCKLLAQVRILSLSLSLFLF